MAGRRILLLLGALWLVCATGAHRVEQKHALSLEIADVHDSYDDDDIDDGIDAAVPTVAHVSPDSDFQNFDTLAATVLVLNPPRVAVVAIQSQTGHPSQLIDRLFRPPRIALL